MNRALLLNADYCPLHFISDVDAIILVYNCRAEVVTMDNVPSVWEETWSTVSKTENIPATVRLLRRVNKKWKSPRFRKKVLFNRDNWQCQYCLSPLTYATVTIEHIVPRSRGGATTWLNCVSACKPCNKRKANRTPAEAGMPLLKQPTVPTAFHFWDSQKTSCTHPDWETFLPSQ